MKRPLIGVTCNYDYRDTVGMTSGMGIVGQDWNFVAGDYVYILEKAGAIPVLIPVYKDCDEESIKEFLNKLDGVIISGGHDVGPEQYNTPTKGYCGTIIPQRDNHDIAVAKYFMNEIKKPILGICKGMQVINIYFGGRIIQDLPTNTLHQYTDRDQVHPSHALPGTVLQKLYGSDFPVNSAHHQGIGSPGRDLFIIQYAPDDVPEAIIHKTLPILGVQWHPERMCFEHRRTDTPDGSLLLTYFLSLIP